MSVIIFWEFEFQNNIYSVQLVIVALLIDIVVLIYNLYYSNAAYSIFIVVVFVGRQERLYLT